MIEIKRCNYITGEPSSVSYGLSKIVDFLDLSGRNILLLSRDTGSVSSMPLLKHFIKTASKEFNNKEKFQSILDDKSNLFRIDLLVVDLWHIKTVTSVSEYKDILDKTGIDYMIVSNKYHYKIGDDISIYKIDKETFDDDTNWMNTRYKYIVTDLINNWKSSIDDLIISYRRDKKIDDIFGENNA